MRQFTAGGRRLRFGEFSVGILGPSLPCAVPIDEGIRNFAHMKHDGKHVANFVRTIGDCCFCECEVPMLIIGQSPRSLHAWAYVSKTVLSTVRKSAKAREVYSHLEEELAQGLVACLLIAEVAQKVHTSPFGIIPMSGSAAAGASSSTCRLPSAPASTRVSHPS